MKRRIFLDTNVVIDYLYKRVHLAKMLNEYFHYHHTFLKGITLK